MCGPSGCRCLRRRLGAPGARPRQCTFCRLRPAPCRTADHGWLRRRGYAGWRRRGRPHVGEEMDGLGFLQMLPERVRSCGHGTPAVCAALKSAAFSYPIRRGSGKTMIEITFRAKTRESPFAAADTVLMGCTIISCVDFNGRLFEDRPGKLQRHFHISPRRKNMSSTIVWCPSTDNGATATAAGVLLLAF